ncbi:MAG: FAS1-like dehydratase domain-containing protein [Lysobacterales bacterium]|jgi:acyl dehydratase
MSQPAWGKYGSWEETESYLGKVIRVSEGADAVEAGSIRRWLEPKEFDCAIHNDDEAAKAAGYEGIVAPATMVFTYGLPAYWQPGDPPAQAGDEPRQIPIPVIFDVPAPCTLSFATSVDVQFHAPMHIGDRLTVTHRLVDIAKKSLSVGDGAFLTQEDTYTNQRDEIVAISRLVIFRFNPPGDSE